MSDIDVSYKEMDTLFARFLEQINVFKELHTIVFNQNSEGVKGYVVQLGVVLGLMKELNAVGKMGIGFENVSQLTLGLAKGGEELANILGIVRELGKEMQDVPKYPTDGDPEKIRAYYEAVEAKKRQTVNKRRQRELDKLRKEMEKYNDVLLEHARRIEVADLATKKMVKYKKELYDIEDAIREIEEGYKVSGVTQKQIEEGKKLVSIYRERMDVVTALFSQEQKAFSEFIERSDISNPLEFSDRVAKESDKEYWEDVEKRIAKINKTRNLNKQTEIQVVKQLKEQKDLLDSLGDSAYELYRIFKSIGADGLASIARSASVVFDSFKELEKMRVSNYANNPSGNGMSLAMLGPIASIGGALVGVIKQFSEMRASDREASEKLEREVNEKRQRLIEALDNNAKQITSVIERLIANQIGVSLTGVEQQTVSAGSQAFESELKALLEQLAYYKSPEYINDVRANADDEDFDRYINPSETIRSVERQIKTLFNDYLKQLEENNVLTDSERGNLSEILDEQLQLGTGIGDAIRYILDEISINGKNLGDVIGLLGNDFGGFANTVNGALARLKFNQDYITNDLNTNYGLFIESLLGANGISGELKGLLEGVQGTLDTEQGTALKALAKQIAESVLGGDSDFLGGISGEDALKISEALSDFADKSGVVDESGSGYSRSVQIERRITEWQADEFIVQMERSNYLLEQILDVLGGVDNNVIGVPLETKPFTTATEGGFSVDVGVVVDGAVNKETIEEIIEQTSIAMRGELLSRTNQNERLF